MLAGAHPANHGSLERSRLVNMVADPANEIPKAIRPVTNITRIL